MDDASTIAAWIGAATGSIALGFDLYKWLRSGPRLRLDVFPNMVFMPPEDSAPKGQQYLSIRVANDGDKDTVLTTIALSFYSSRWKYRWNLAMRWWPPRRHSFVTMADRRFFVNAPGLPTPLEVGSRQYTHMCPQEEWVELVEESQGILLCHAYHSLSEQPTTRRIRGL